ncbi:transposase [Pasteuria penetrans]|uniref:transposase n=1 Tax=Pasteuria penetrans TaxID=86005 RepID=UPI0011ED750B|nr:transposase [Pasteuria penetrans]
MSYPIDDISNFPDLHGKLERKKRREQVRKKKPNLSEQPWEDHEGIGAEEKSRLLMLQTLATTVYGFPNEEKSSRTRVIDHHVSILCCFVMAIWNLQSERELINIINGNKMIRDIIGITKGFSRSLYDKNIKKCIAKNGETIIFNLLELLSEEDQKVILSEIKEKYLFLDQVIVSTSRRAKDTATLRNYKGFHRGIGVTGVATMDGRIPLVLAMGPANLGEVEASCLLIPEISTLGCRGLVADSAYDVHDLFELCKQHGLKLLAGYNKRRAKTQNSITSPLRKENFYRLQTKGCKELMKKRSSGEHCFTILKHTMGLDKHRQTSYNKAFMLIVSYMMTICFDSMIQKKNNINIRKSPGRRFYQQIS